MLISHLKIFALLVAGLGYSISSVGATWVKLNDSAHSKLLLDKQSIVTQAPLKKVWVKVEYKSPQKNPDSVDKVYNLSKALWHFDCAQQTSATTQVFQYLNQELVYSANVDMKGAEFIEPLPESDLEAAMHYVCKSSHAVPVPKPAPTNAPTVKATDNPSPATPTPATPANQEVAQENTAKPTPVVAKDKPEAAPAKAVSSTPAATATATAQNKSIKSSSANDWSYHGKTGPDQWGKVNKQYATCASGVNQSPVIFESTIHAALKPIRVIHKFAAKEILSIPNGLRVHFKEGNMMVLDKNAFQLKHMDIHSPSEHQLNGQSYPLEIQLFHEDSKKNLAVMSVLFKTGEPNAELTELLAQVPQKSGELIKLKTRFTPNELMPTNLQYYRYSGSLTTPPCQEGVRWVIMKSPLQASADQIKSISTAIGSPNNRPSQPLHGRNVLE